MHLTNRAADYVEPGTADLIVVYDEIGEILVLHVFDEVDFVNAGSLANEINEVSLDRPLVVELSQCNFVDAACITVLERALKRRGDRFRIVASPGSLVERVLRIVQPICELPLANSIADALQQFGRAEERHHRNHSALKLLHGLQRFTGLDGRKRRRAKTPVQDGPV